MLKTFSNKGEANAIPFNAENLNFNFTELINILHPVGEYFYTSDANFNPNTVWCGTWVLENDGTVLVSKSNESDSAFNINAGNIVGEEKHLLLSSEMPSDFPRPRLKDTSQTQADFKSAINTEYTKSWGLGGINNAIQTGGGQPHNNIQPSKIGFRWHRTA